MDYSTQGNNKRRKRSKQRAKKSRNKVGVLIFRVIVSVGIISAFAAAGLVFGAYMGIIENAADLSDFTAVQPTNFASIVYDRDGNEIDRFTGEENREYVSLKGIPENMKNAVIAIEDERFYTHNGIDLKGMVRAVISTLSGTKQGASTLTQQIIKNNVNNLLVNDIESKLQEQYLAVKFEEMLTDQLGTKKAAKDYILETYLNSVSFNHGLYGVQAAAHYYFAGKDVSELTLSECAVIAAITNRPTKYTPALHPDYNRTRQVLILKNMLRLELITQEEYDEAYNDTDVYKRVTQYRVTSGSDASVHDYYSDALREQLVQHMVERKGMSRQTATNLIYNGGLKIYTPKDNQIQSIMSEIFLDDSYFPQYDFEIDVTYIISVKNSITGENLHYEETALVKSNEEVTEFVNSIKDKYLTANMEFLADRTIANPQPQAAMVVLDHHTGQVLGIVGGRGEKVVDRGFNRATQSARHPGSVFKVLASYAPAMDLGRIGAGSILYDEPYKNEQYNYEPKNWTGSFKGPVTVRDGIVNSMNVVTVKNMIDTGVTSCYDYLKQFGFTTLVDSRTENGRTFTDIGPSTALGGLTDGVTQLEVAAAYATIANGGVYNTPMFYTKVVDHNNNVILEANPETDSHVVLKNTTAYILTDIMKDVLTRGTGGKARFQNINMPQAGKTGTSTNTKDLTFAGFTPYYTAAIWLGHDKDKFIEEDAGHHMIIWRTIMERIHENLERKEFEKPGGIVSANLCVDSGLLAVAGLCSDDVRGTRTRSDIFAAGVAPTEYCDKHTTVTIDSATGLLASSSTPAERRKTIIGIIVPDADITENDYEIPESMASGSSTVRLNSKYAGAEAPKEDGYFTIDPFTGEMIFVPTNGGENNIPTIDSENGSYTPTFPNSGFPTFFTPRPAQNQEQSTPSPSPSPSASSGAPTQTYAPVMPQPMFSQPVATPQPSFQDVAPYSPAPSQSQSQDSNIYVPTIPNAEAPSPTAAPVID